MKKTALLAAATALGAVTHAGLITFDNDPFYVLSNAPQGFTSVDSPDLAFYDSYLDDGLGMRILDWDQTLGSPALGVLGDGFFDDFGAVPDPSFLIIEAVNGPVTSLSLDFGNDQVYATTAGDYAQLRGFKNGSLMGSVNVVMNRNGIADQTISIASAAGFDKFELEFITSPTVQDDGLADPFTWTSVAEIVDNVQYEAVPEPASMAVLGLGMAALAKRRRK